ncbi:helix-turn-helix domain-containing protein [Chryseobacterium indoltheticum]|uniref:AraC-type DNA-binding protein n=1 Tax=Chryseobacterium indoltheticum TaxID=254 RepID=A0A381FEX5_9FLAO|nr:helix-turn-helix domain-containing protein [Chryseobacterium indoltheticum]AZA74276.1 helix-turn-helix domain-containing protein [Chryseobacterium indoltheticum]SIQ01171.1 AraC-type DNA-binding protein [Chryseobacterium indoltheticum]SUX45067.1 Chb operon repressor [Chryseobacterium indoltheticum]
MKKLFSLIIFFLFLILHSQDKEKFDKIYVKTYLETSQKDFNKALKIADSLFINSADPLLKTRSLMLSASLYQQKGDYKKAVDFALLAEKTITETDDISWKVRVYGFLASQYRILKLYDLSKKYIDEAMTSSKKLGDSLARKQVVGLMMQEKAYFEIQNKNFKKAVLHVKSSQELLKNVKKNHDFFTANNEQLLGLCFYHLKDYKTSLQHYNEAERQLKNLPESFLIGLVYNGIANTYMDMGNFKDAERELQKARVIADKTQYLNLKTEIYDTAQRLYLAKMDVNKIQEYKFKHDRAQDQLDIGTSQFYNASLKDAETKSTVANNNSSAKNMVIIFVIILLAVFCIYFLYYKKAEKRTYVRFKAIIAELNKRRALESESDNLKDSGLESAPPHRTAENVEDLPMMTIGTEEKLLDYLEKFEKSDQYLKNDISLPGLAAYCKTNTKYLSRIINIHKGMDFNNYINKLRIQYIIEKLNNEPEYMKYKIATLAEEAGFSSQNKFATIFKKVTSISPSVFIKYLQDQKNNYQQND